MPITSTIISSFSTLPFVFNDFSLFISPPLLPIAILPPNERASTAALCNCSIYTHKLNQLIESQFIINSSVSLSRGLVLETKNELLKKRKFRPSGLLGTNQLHGLCNPRSVLSIQWTSKRRRTQGDVPVRDLQNILVRPFFDRVREGISHRLSHISAEQPSVEGENSSNGGDAAGRAEGLLWYKDSGQHVNGEFSMVVIQVNSLLEDYSQLE
ncbi:unnamed protein product [Dovyalis caffra]|uniref:Uncharacterized protein n=1 Tax=Dovyalis caffra TaxID=77055 RepID=A0AAV1R1Z0_9ROSI|nr:unnamed protein product [Dovyalis caffra]